MPNKMLTLVAFVALSAGPAFAETPPAHEDRPAVSIAGQAAAARSALSTAQGKLAIALIENLAKPNAAHTIVSPASVASVFALVGEGADGPMRTAIAETLGFPARDSAQAFTALKEARKALAVDARGQLQFADRLVLPPGSAPAPELLARLEAQGANTSVMDLTKLEAVAEIDGWVKETTKGAIPALLITPLDDPAFVALDALRFKGQWKMVFDLQLTRPTPFKDLDGNSSEVAMMRLAVAPRAFRTDERFIGVRSALCGRALLARGRDDAI